MHLAILVTRPDFARWITLTDIRSCVGAAASKSDGLNRSGRCRVDRYPVTCKSWGNSIMREARTEILKRVNTAK